MPESRLDFDVLRWRDKINILQRLRSRRGKSCIAGTGLAEGWSPGELGIRVGSLGDQCPRREAEGRLSLRLACRCGAGRRQSARVACRRWMVPYDRGRKSCTAGADARLRRLWERGRLVEKALVPQMIVQVVEVPQNVSRDRIRQRTDERMDGTPVLKVLVGLVESILERILEPIADVLLPQMGALFGAYR